MSAVFTPVRKRPAPDFPQRAHHAREQTHLSTRNSVAVGTAWQARRASAAAITTLLQWMIAQQTTEGARS
jgi:hypothetical protein